MDMPSLHKEYEEIGNQDLELGWGIEISKAHWRELGWRLRDRS